MVTFTGTLKSHREKRREDKVADLTKLRLVLEDLCEFVDCNRPFPNPKERLATVKIDRSKPTAIVGIVNFTDGHLGQVNIDIGIKEPRQVDAATTATQARDQLTVIISSASAGAKVNGLNSFSLKTSARDAQKVIEVSFTSNFQSLQKITCGLEKARDILINETDKSVALKKITQTLQNEPTHVELSAATATGIGRS